jgi:hypothetical protein
MVPWSTSSKADRQRLQTESRDAPAQGLIPSAPRPTNGAEVRKDENLPVAVDWIESGGAVPRYPLPPINDLLISYFGTDRSPARSSDALNCRRFWILQSTLASARSRSHTQRRSKALIIMARIGPSHAER